MDLIVETDLGRDPDDFFALLYLVAAGARIRAITLSPGDKDQVAVARFLCRELGLDIPIGSAGPEREKSSVGSVHVDLLKKYQWPSRQPPDALGQDVLRETMARYPEAEWFIIGPLQNVGGYLASDSPRLPRRATMQGGFVGYHLHAPSVRLEKFEGRESVATFNLNGDVKSAQRFLTHDIPRRFVGKNVCHTMVYDRDILRRHREHPPRSRAMELFLEAMAMYLAHSPEKMFHDPTAAVCHLHPEVGTWLPGELFREKGGWGTRPGGRDAMLVELQREAVWTHIFTGT
ncbi:nucleoside hydrolase [Myxococcaceae bacterium JPH2]|nr:nucleoside hydrolase [Myxococcaceae bacterium JPH2]